MTRPTPELLTATFTECGSESGYWKLRHAGYEISRDECRQARAKVIAEGKAQLTPWTEERLAKVREMAAAGASGAAIAEAVNAPRRAVYDLCSRLSITVGKSRALALAPPVEEFEKIFYANSIAKAAEILNVSTHTIRRWVVAYGLKRPAPIKPAEKRARPVRPMRNLKGAQGFRMAAVPTQEYSAATEAATYLRQQGYANVYRRSWNEWQVGARPMSEKDMLARVDEMKARRARLAELAL